MLQRRKYFVQFLDPDREIRVNWESGLVGHACLTRTILNLEDAYRYPLFNPTVDRETGFHKSCVMHTDHGISGKCHSMCTILKQDRV